MSRRYLVVSSPFEGTPPPASLIGGKAHNLARLAAAGAEVPPWIVVSADAFRELVLGEARGQAARVAAAASGAEGAAAEVAAPGLPEEPAALRSAAGAALWQQRIRERGVPEPLRSELREAVGAAGLEGHLLAVRSSAVAEDSVASSYAGQFDTVLGVASDEVDRAVAAVWASAANPHALAYGGSLTPMGVIIQAMVDADVSGVAFGVDPVSGDEEVAVIGAVWGLGEGLVSGDLDGDSYRVHFAAAEAVRVESTMASKTHRVRLLPDGGTVREALPVGMAGEAPTLAEEDVIRIARATRRLGNLLGGPQDVEWAFDRSDPPRLYILQARPITTVVDRRGERRVWDNSNIIESYAGVTSPLTFSFARAVYEEVYRQFCAVVGVPQSLIDQHRHVFANMLGLVRGRVYYNLLNWYRTLALLPGYSVNRTFMERMMGVREKLSDPPALEATSGRGVDALRLARMVARLVRESRGLATAVPAFHARVDQALLPLSGEDLTSWGADRLMSLYRSLEDDLLRNWQTPLVNDFFAMIWFGVLGRIVESWLPDAPPTLANDLLMNEGGIISAEPAERIRAIARQAQAEPAVLAHFEAEADPRRLERRIAGDPDCAGFMAEVDGYIARFGDRCMNELKLETVTLGEDASFLFQTIRGYLRADEAGEAGAVADGQSAPTRGPTRSGGQSSESPPHAGGAAGRARAEALVRQRLGGVRHRIFAAVLAQTRARVRDRENLRFERTRVFGVVRRIFVGLGHHLARAERLADPRDIFFLRIEEIFGYVDGTAVGADLREIVRVRKGEWEEYARLPAPPDRFESYGPVAEGRWVAPAPAAVSVAGEDADVLRGVGCCPGIVRAPVRLVREPRDAGDLTGHILVAERTDPGWTLIFPTARGILVERGSLLSHSAIVAREMGIPCVVSIPGLMTTLRDGEMVEMDGAAGSVRRMDG